MGHGVGPSQQRILEALRQGPATVPELAALLERSQRQVRAAVTALEARGLVRTTRTPGAPTKVWRPDQPHRRTHAQEARELAALQARIAALGADRLEAEAVAEIERDELARIWSLPSPER